jgi:hypothetical protein
MLFAAILVYFAKERMIGGDGMVGFSCLAIAELAMEIGLLAAIVTRH